MTDDAWRLDPSRFPQRLDLELSETVLEKLEKLSRRSGRPVGDLAADLLAQAVAGMDPSLT